MKYPRTFNESKLLFNEEWKKFLPTKIYLSTDNGDWELEKSDVIFIGDLIEVSYYQNTPENSGDVLSDGEPDYLSFEIHITKNTTGTKLLVDITYGDAMSSEFSIESPNKINVIHYNGIKSKYDPYNWFGFKPQTIKDLVVFFNSLDPEYKLTTTDFKFIDSDLASYRHDINDPKHLYNDDSDLIKFGNGLKKD